VENCGRSSPLSLASLPYHFGGLGKGPECGGKRASIGAFGFASLLWGAGLQSLVAAADEEYIGSFAEIASALISFYKNTELPVYIRIAIALEGTDDMDAATGCATIKGLKQAYERMGRLGDSLSEDESKIATELVKGSILVEVPGAYDPERPDPAPEPITLPEPRFLSDYTTAPCKHKCCIYKQIRHAKHAHRLLTTLNPTKQALLRASAGQCGLNSAHCHSSTVKDVVSLDRPGGVDGGSREAALLCAAILSASFQTARRLRKTEDLDSPGDLCLLQRASLGPCYSENEIG
jgi:hypothetical protein